MTREEIQENITKLSYLIAEKESLFSENPTDTELSGQITAMKSDLSALEAKISQASDAEGLERQELQALGVKMASGTATISEMQKFGALCLKYARS